jgi:hypothetical protein
VIDTKSKLRDALYDNGDLLKRLLQEDGNLLDKEQRHCLAALLPLCTVYIYCAPCACLIHTALRVGGRIGSRLVEIVVRPDDRLISSCCTSSGRTIGLRSVLDHVRQWEAHWAGESEIAGFLDRTWVERRLDHFEYEEPYTYREPKADAIILGEVDYLAPLLQRAPGRIPKAMQIWAFSESRTHPVAYTRSLSSSFIEKRQLATSSPQQIATPSSSKKRARESSDDDEASTD